MTTKAEEFEALYQAYWSYVYKYEVGDSWQPNKAPSYHRRDFEEQLQDAGMTIKVTEGY